MCESMKSFLDQFLVILVSLGFIFKLCLDFTFLNKGERQLGFSFYSATEEHIEFFF